MASEISKLHYMDAEGKALFSSISTIFRPSRLIVEPWTPHVSVRWRHARIAATSLTNTVTFEGLRDHTVLPCDFPEVGVIAISKEETDREQRDNGGIHAVAYALGSTVMVGVMEKREIFQILADEDQYAVAMGIGHSDLIATSGLWSPDTKQLWTPETSIVDKGRYAVGQQPSGIHRV
jgi:hypothetical protein